MEESRRAGAECPGGSCTSGSERPPEGVDFRTAGDLEGEDSDQIIEELSGNEGEAVLGKSFLE